MIVKPVISQSALTAKFLLALMELAGAGVDVLLELALARLEVAAGAVAVVAAAVAAGARDLVDLLELLLDDVLLDAAMAAEAGRAGHRPHLLRAVVHVLVVSHSAGDAWSLLLCVQCLLPTSEVLVNCMMR